MNTPSQVRCPNSPSSQDGPVKPFVIPNAARSLVVTPAVK